MDQNDKCDHFFGHNKNKQVRKGKNPEGFTI